MKQVLYTLFFPILMIIGLIVYLFFLSKKVRRLQIEVIMAKTATEDKRLKKEIEMLLQENEKIGIIEKILLEQMQQTIANRVEKMSPEQVEKYWN